MQRNWTQHLLLRALTISKKESINEKIIANLSEEYFSTPLYKIAFRRLNNFYLKNGRILTWKELIADSSFPSSLRRKLRAREVKRKKLCKFDSFLILPKNYDEYQNILGSVSYDAKQIKLIEFQNYLTENVGEKNSEKKQIDNILSQCSATVESIRSLGETSSYMFDVTDKNVREKLKKFYKKLKSGFYLPTNFSDFDSRNLGIPLDSYFLIAARTGCGKSSLALQLGINMKRFGARVCFVPLEMSIEQMLIKLGSNLIEVPVNKIVANLKHYYKPMIKRIRKFIGSSEDSSECFYFYEPNLSETLDQCLSVLKPYKFDIIFIDYINLMAPMGGKEDWRALDEAGRYAKRFATNNQTVICLLAQLDETEKRVRYSRALAEHACVSINSFINTGGKLKKVKNIVELPLSKNKKYEKKVKLPISTVNGERNTKKVYHFGRQKVKKITTSKGYSLISTDITPLLVLNKDLSMSWTKIKNLKIGQRVAIKRNCPFSNKNVKFDFRYIPTKNDPRQVIFEYLPNKMTPKFARLIGYLIAEGSFGGYRVFFGNASKIVCNDFTRLWKKVFKEDRPFSSEMKNRQYEFVVNSKHLCSFFKYLGVAGNSRTFEIPWCILQSSKRCALEFLRGYLEGDGSCSNGGATVTTYSRKLSEQIQILLLKFGIISSRNQYEDKCNRKKNLSPKHYRLNICGYSMNKFMEQIGFITDRKNNRFREAIKSDTENIPYIVQLLESKKHGRNQYTCENGKNKMVALLSVVGLAGGTKNLNPKKINEKFKKNLKSAFPTIYNRLKLLVKSKLFFDEVVKIKKGKAIIRDFTVEETNTNTMFDEGNFIANGFVVHNSNAWYWFESKEEIAELNAIKIYQKKARNQNPFSFRLSTGLAISSFKTCLREEGSERNYKRKKGIHKLAKGMDDLPSNSDV